VLQHDIVSSALCPVRVCYNMTLRHQYNSPAAGNTTWHCVISTVSSQSVLQHDTVSSAWQPSCS